MTGQALNEGRVHFKDFVSISATRIAVYVFEGLSVGGFFKTEGELPFFISPVGHSPASVQVFDFKVSPMHPHEVFSSDLVADIMAVHVDGHNAGIGSIVLKVLEVDVKIEEIGRSFQLVLVTFFQRRMGH